VAPASSQQHPSQHPPPQQPLSQHPRGHSHAPPQQPALAAQPPTGALSEEIATAQILIKVNMETVLSRGDLPRDEMHEKPARTAAQSAALSSRRSPGVFKTQWWWTQEMCVHSGSASPSRARVAGDSNHPHAQAGTHRGALRQRPRRSNFQRPVGPRTKPKRPHGRRPDPRDVDPGTRNTRRGRPRRFTGALARTPAHRRRIALTKGRIARGRLSRGLRPAGVCILAAAARPRRELAARLQRRRPRHRAAQHAQRRPQPGHRAGDHREEPARA